MELHGVVDHPTEICQVCPYIKIPVLAVRTTSLKKKKLRGLSPRANYTDRAAAAGRRS